MYVYVWCTTYVCIFFRVHQGRCRDTTVEAAAEGVASVLFAEQNNNYYTDQGKTKQQTEILASRAVQADSCRSSRNQPLMKFPVYGHIPILTYPCQQPILENRIGAPDFGCWRPAVGMKAAVARNIAGPTCNVAEQSPSPDHLFAVPLGRCILPHPVHASPNVFLNTVSVGSVIRLHVRNVGTSRGAGRQTWSRLL